MYPGYWKISTRWHSTIRLSPKRQCSRQEVMKRDGRCTWTQHQLVCHPLGRGSDMTSVFDLFHTQIHVSFQLVLIYLSFVLVVRWIWLRVWDSLVLIRTIHVRRSLSAFLGVSSHYWAIVHTANKLTQRPLGNLRGQNWGLFGDIRTVCESLDLNEKFMTVHNSWKKRDKWLCE